MKTTLHIFALLLPLLCGCESGIEPVPFQGVSGTVEFQGQVPDSTEWVRLGAFRQKPTTAIELLSFEAITDALLLFEDSTRYALGLDTGLFEWLPVIAKRENTPVPAGLRVLGWYTEGGGAFDPPEAFVVTGDEETAGINVIADFENPLTLEEALEIIQ